ncbi:MAG: alpha/beta hydrolase [Actinomycetota bacterium]|nr:alpha/beta hydrolase [Actinomycetota bacterium]
MPRRPTRTVATVLLHGWEGSGPGHWQSWLAERLHAAGREVRFPGLPDADHPALGPWLAALGTTLEGLPDDGFDVVAHSLGAVLWLHHVAAAGESPRPARVALVAPPSPRTAIPEIASFFPVPLDVDVVRRSAGGGPPARAVGGSEGERGVPTGVVASAGGTVLVGSDADPYTPEGVAVAYGLPLKMSVTIVAGGGHLNTDAGYGEWPAVLDWCGRDNLAFIA